MRQGDVLVVDPGLQLGNSRFHVGVVNGRQGFVPKAVVEALRHVHKSALEHVRTCAAPC